MIEPDKQKSGDGGTPKDSESELTSRKGHQARQEAISLKTRDIDDPDARFIYILPDTAIAVDRTTGQILGQGGEGTLGVVIYGGEAKERKGKRFEAERAIRIPRLLQGDVLLNFHVAEIVYHESRQASKFGNVPTLLGANNFYRLDEANSFTRIPEEGPVIPTVHSVTAASKPVSKSSSDCFIGFYLSPTSHYGLCLVSEQQAWPAKFSDYLEKIGFPSERLFRELERKAESKEVNVFSKLFFLPDNIKQKTGSDNSSPISESPLEIAEQGTNGQEHDSPLQELNREDLDQAHAAKREVGGWWFNIPVAIYPWMTANLERLLTAHVADAEDDAVSTQTPTLTRWNVRQWFQLINQLAAGFNELHQRGAIHGDPRPANVMTNIYNEPDFRPSNFRWIDIGLGYGARDVIRSGGSRPIDEDSVISPRPLGGGRTTIFYAPEREEALEFEDADMVHLEQSQSDRSLSELTFFWRERSHLAPTELQLKDGDTPLRELGRLMRGDRVQVREFLFDVHEVKEKSIIVSGIYEILLDRVLVEKREARPLVHERLRDAAISRYRIFKQWSQATDIYSLGIISLYVFFLRGVRKIKTSSGRRSDESMTDQFGKRSTYDQTNREKTFSELASLMRNRSFLGNILTVFKQELRDPTWLWERDLTQPISEAQKKAEEKVAEEILIRDANFIFVWRGLEGSNSLFIRLIYFCFACLWRADEIRESLEGRDIKFAPFCVNRLMMQKEDERALPSRKALALLERLDAISSTVPAYDGKLPDFVDLETILRSRENQWMSMTDNLAKAKTRIDSLEASLMQTREMERKSSEKLQNAETLSSQIHVALKTVLLHFDKSTLSVLWNRNPIRALLTNAAQLAKRIGMRS